MAVNPDILRLFDTISLDEMGKVRLMNRIDTKFVTTPDLLEDLLRMAASDYLVQQIDGEVDMPYFTRYYDTADTDMFYQHQRGKKSRQKIRVRKYEQSDTPPFIEIKSKNNKGRSKKKRVEMNRGDSPENYSDFLERHALYEAEQLNPRLENHFYRITLVDKARTERVTIDTNLEFHNLVTGRKAALPQIVIIEWKRDGRLCKSGLNDILRRLRIHPTGFSKYCIGMAITDSDLKQNRLKKKIRRIERIGGRTLSEL